MLELIADIRAALRSDCPYSALALALTLPDICSQVKEHTLNGKRELYADWFDTYVYHPYYKHEDVPKDKVSFFEFKGEYCYLLRCRFLHNGNTCINQNSGKIIVNISKFELSTTNIPGKHLDTVAIHSNADNSDIYRLCSSICDAAEQFYTSWPNKDDFENHSIILADTKNEFQQFNR